MHRTDIEVFERRYVLGREIARVCGVSPKAVALRLKEIGVLPVSGPGVDGSLQVVYERSTIEAVINALPQDDGGPDQKAARRLAARRRCPAHRPHFSLGEARLD